MPPPDSLERRFGRYAIRGLIGYIAFFQCLVFVVHYANKDFVSNLQLRPFSGMDGEWWRLFSFILVSRTESPLLFFFSIMVMLICMHGLEAELGAFRVNLFVAFFFLCQWSMAALMDTPAGTALMAATGGDLSPGSTFFATNLFLTFAVLFPAKVFTLFGVVPLQAWVLALVDGGVILVGLVNRPASWLSTTISLLPFLCFGLPFYLRHLNRRTLASRRRARYKANSLSAADSFHECAVCGRTEVSDPELDFRVTEEGLEYCVDHLPRDTDLPPGAAVKRPL